MAAEEGKNYVVVEGDVAKFTILGAKLKLDGASDVEPLAAALKPYTSKDAPNQITTVILSGNTFAAEAVKELSKSLKELESLTSVNASDIFTTRLQTEVPPSIDAFADAFRDKEKLTELDLSDNALGPSGAKALGELLRTNHNLRTLRVHNDGLGQDGGKHIAAALLGKSGIEEEEDVDPQRVAKLTTFISGRNRLENPGAEALAKTFKVMRSLTALQIPQNGIRPEGIVAIAEALKENKGLTILDLNDNNIREKGAVALAAAFVELPELRKVNLGDCLVGSKGVIAIAKSLASHTNLEELDLSYDEIGDTAAVALAKVLANKKSLKRLELNGNKLRSEGIEAIKQALEESELNDALGSLSENDEEEEDDEAGEDEDEDEDEEKEDDDD